MDIGGRSIRWLPAAVLLAVGAALHAVAVWLVWRPCAGSMLNGSILVGYRYPTEFSDACLAAMNDNPIFPMLGNSDGATGLLGTAAALALATAWPAVLPAFGLRGWHRPVAMLPSLLVITGALLTALGAGDGWSGPGGTLLLFANLAVPAALVALARAGVRGATLGRATVVALAAATPGLISQAAEYVVAITFSDAFWDKPPGTGWFTSAFCLVAAVVTAALWWRAHARGPVASYAGDRPAHEPAAN
ncbi:hypothetical protein GCM10028820_12510 [Tessaracoccus terricola]